MSQPYWRTSNVAMTAAILILLFDNIFTHRHPSYGNFLNSDGGFRDCGRSGADCGFGKYEGSTLANLILVALFTAV